MSGTRFPGILLQIILLCNFKTETESMLGWDAVHIVAWGIYFPFNTKDLNYFTP